MKETKKSLKWWFIIVGIGGLWGIRSIGFIKEDIIAGIFVLIKAIFGGLFFYIGIKVEELLDKSQKFIINILFADLVFVIISLLYSLYSFLEGLPIAIFIISLLLHLIGVIIIIYLIKNVKRLSNINEPPTK